ncbi:MAG: sensor protein [Cyanobacteria bacterium RYN_339]|nr:sensor protein [Cyanobacteria bacterium RYN_339]
MVTNAKSPTLLEVDTTPVIVGLGASAGGLEALKAFFTALPPNVGAAFVVIQHMSPKADTMLAELLARDTVMTVSLLEGPAEVLANHVYVGPPGKCVSLQEGKLVCEPMQADGGLPIDAFFRSLAEDRLERAIGIVLSGTASDGTLGLKALKERGGVVLVQEPTSAAQGGMPRSAIQTGLADAIMPPAGLAALVTSYVQNLGMGIPMQEPVQAILTALRARTKHDFRHYKRGTVVRRIHRRMGLRAVDSPTHYLTLLLAEPDELMQLHQDLLIGVTRFFRDPDAFAALTELVLKPMIAERKDDEPIRVWVPGCATGEEAYSLSMALMEVMAEAGVSYPIKIFATDIDVKALDVARTGIYPATAATELSPERIKRFFSQGEFGLQVRQELRETVVFAEQNLIGDPPFSRLDLISCRNLLIYLEPEIQRKVITLFQFTLRPDGALFLGTSESLAGRDVLFKPLSKKWRIYRRSNVPTPVDYPLSAKEPMVARVATQLDRSGAASLGNLVQHELLTDFTPAAVLVNERFEILYFHGGVGLYLTFPTGRTSYDLMAMCPARVRSKLRRAMRDSQSHRGQEQVVLAWDEGGLDARVVAVAVKPLRSSDGHDLFLFAFTDAPTIPSLEGSMESGSNLAFLEAELKSARDELKSTTEEMETANEELKASNEEMMSMNEELQATNEELETTKEELQSLNEELTTVNQELHGKLQELEEANNDLVNFLSSTDTATIFLDLQLRIRRFTPATGKLLNILPSDVGRPLLDLAAKVEDATMLPDVEAVIAHLAPREREVRTPRGAWYLRRVVPYRTRDQRIDGVVVTFTDISHLKANEAAKTQEEMRRHLATVEEQAAELSAVNVRLLALDRLKADFLNAASHELRTPLTSIMGFSEFLEDDLAGALSEGQRGFVNQIQQSARRLRKLVDDLLDFARLEAGTFKLAPRELDLKDIVRDALESLEPQRQDRKLDLHQVIPELPVKLVGDADRLEQVLLNLVGNAIKFTPPGGCITVSVIPAVDRVRVEVTDTGVGIAPEAMGHLFDRFYQADPSMTREYGGAGLGLAISKALVEAHGGNIDVSSIPGHGSTFWFDLPVGL